MKKILYFNFILILMTFFNITLTYAKNVTQEEILNYIHTTYSDSPYEIEWILPPLIWRESRFQSDVIGAGKYYGLTQLNPKYYDIQDPLDPKKNIDCCANYLIEKIDEYGSPQLALMMWNLGENKAWEYYKQGVVTDYASDIYKLSQERKYCDE